MTKNEYIELIHRMGLQCDEHNSLDAFCSINPLYPVCGYRTIDPYNVGWGNNALIIYEDFFDNVYGVKYRGKSTSSVVVAEKLVLNRIKELKKSFVKNKKRKIEMDFT